MKTAKGIVKFLWAMAAVTVLGFGVHSAQAAAKVQQHNIVCKVVDQNNRLVNGADVTLTSKTNGHTVARSVEKNRNGAFFQKSKGRGALQNHTYQVTVTAKGYIPATVSTKKVVDDNQVVVVTLRKKDNKAPGNKKITIASTAKMKTYKKAAPKKAGKSKLSIKWFTVTPSNTGAQNGVTNTSFGTFYNNKAVVTVQLGKSKNSVTAKKVVLKLYNTNGKLKKTIYPFLIDSNNGQVQFKLPNNFNGTMKAVATDNSNQTTKEVLANKKNSAMKNSSGLIMTESGKAAISSSQGKTIAVAGNKNGSWYNSEVGFQFTVEDKKSGINFVNAKMVLPNNQTVTLVNDNFVYKNPKKKTEKKSYSLNTKNIKTNLDGTYRLQVSVRDNAGNITQHKEIQFQKDTGKPQITNITIQSGGKTYKTQTPSLQKAAYEYYSQGESTITIYTKDVLGGAGVKAVTYYTVDSEQNKSDEKTVQVNPNNTVSVAVPPSFKGQIFVRTEDKAGNKQDQFVTPASFIIENKEKHEQEEHIAFEYEQAQSKNKAEQPVYNKDVPVKITAKDSFAGIAKISWYVKAPYNKVNNQRGKVVIDNNKVQTGTDTGWDIEQQEDNLVTQMSKTVLINNNSDNIVLKVVVTDRAGNQSEKEMTLNIDKVAPKVKITYDNGQTAQKGTAYFNGARTATITIVERSFDKDTLQFTLENTNGQKPVVSEWVQKENKKDPNKNKYTATVRFEEEGQYRLNVSCTDYGGNVSAALTTQEFVIDKTAPKIAIQYSETPAANGSFYKQDRTAVVTVNEKYFDKDNLKIQIEGQKGAKVPKPSEIQSENNTHKITYVFKDDGEYKFNIVCTDKAGNKTQETENNSFVIDKTKPQITITGVQNKNAHTGRVAPVVLFADNNFSQKDTQIELVGTNNGKIETKGSWKNSNGGKQFVFEQLKNTKETDDIYTLKVTTTDLAGNSQAKQMSFSVNRFGSVYTFSQDLKNIVGKYVKDEVDVVVTETNVSALKSGAGKVRVTRNNAVVDLKEGIDYTVTNKTVSGGWSTYVYTIPKEKFAADGKYKILFSSVDTAGNRNDNSDEEKQAAISFGIDKTAPVVAPLNIENNTQYSESKKDAVISIQDNLVLEQVKVYINGKETPVAYNGQNYQFTVSKNMGQQNVEIVATDAAGNETCSRVQNVLVSKNVVAKWVNNTPVFLLSMAVILAAAWYIYKHREKLFHKEVA